jgi:hypothetical protein
MLLKNAYSMRHFRALLNLAFGLIMLAAAGLAAEENVPPDAVVLPSGHWFIPPAPVTSGQGFFVEVPPENAPPLPEANTPGTIPPSPVMETGPGPQNIENMIPEEPHANEPNSAYFLPPMQGSGESPHIENMTSGE